MNLPAVVPLENYDMDNIRFSSMEKAERLIRAGLYLPAVVPLENYDDNLLLGIFACIDKYSQLLSQILI